MSGLSSTGVYFSQLIDYPSQAVSGIMQVLNVPFYWWVTLALLVLAFLPSTHKDDK